MPVKPVSGQLHSAPRTAAAGIWKFTEILHTWNDILLNADTPTIALNAGSIDRQYD